MAKRALLIQLARLGDLVQTVPVITALNEAYDEDLSLDLLCPAHLEGVGRILPGIAAVIPWDGAAWNQRARVVEHDLLPDHVAEADAALRTIVDEPYECAFVLNQHPRAVLAGALLARKSLGAVSGGPVDRILSPWATYLRSVASERTDNRIHLADAFCGMCGVAPPKSMRPLQLPSVPLPSDLDAIGRSEGPWIGVLVGAGEQERRVPVTAWARLITDCLVTLSGGRVVLIGSEQEQERAHWIQGSLPASLAGRVWDTTGRLSLPELAVALTRCQSVVGADTGPLHLAVAVGSRVIGWYFARARVHETGPYGSHHWIWQAEGVGGQSGETITPEHWPIDETIALLANQPFDSVPDWSLWESHRDRWGAYYVQTGQEPVAPLQREQVWKDLHPTAV